MKVIGEKLVKRFDMTSPAAIARDGGTITGSPTFSRAGIDLDGSADYVTYAIPNTLLASTILNIEIVFTPDFAHDDGANHYFLDSTNGSRLIIVKNSINALDLYVSSTNIAAIPAVTYGAYWNVGKRNVLTFDFTSGDSNAWLNGTQIMTGDSTTFSTSYPTELYVGTRYTLTQLFDGEIESVAFKSEVLDRTDNQNLYDQSTYNFMNKADIWLDMKTQANDGTNDITRDKSGQGNHFLIGDGSTASTQPTFNNPGFDLDGSTDYLLNSSATGIYNNTYQTIAICFTPDFAWDGNADYYLYDSTAAAEYSVVKEDNAASNVLTITLGNTAIASVAATAFSPHWNARGKNVLIVTGTTGDTDAFLNGKQILDSDSTAWSAANPADILLGAEQGLAGSWFNGEILHFSTYGQRFAQKMSPTQARFLTDQLMVRYS